MQPFSPASFEAAIEHLASKRHRRFAGEFALSDLARDVEFVAHELSALVLRKQYTVSPAIARHAFTDGKERTLFRSTALDAVVELVLARVLAAAFEEFYPSALYSYRKARSQKQALCAFAEFVRAHRDHEPDPKRRGLFVLRRDVKSYGESIRVDEDSPLWPLVERALGNLSATARDAALSLLHQLLPRTYVDRDGATQVLSPGTPTGSAIQPMLNNLYLIDLDAKLSELGFYLRFGDDLLFATESAATARSANDLIQSEFRDRGLLSKVEKELNLDFNGAARSRLDGFSPTDVVNYLGMRVSFRGNVGLRADKWRRVLRETRQRMRRAMHGGDDRSPDQRTRDLVVLARNAFNVSETLSLRDAPTLRFVVDDRVQLRELDNLLCLYAAELVTNQRGVRAFRKKSKKDLFLAGFPSQLQQRNVNTRKGRRP